MLALSIQQPWAWAIVMGFKPIENRTWFTNFRGKFLVHAGKKIDKDGIEFLRDEMDLDLPDEFQTGGIVGISTIVNCATKHWSNFFFGPYGFVLDNSHPVEFIPLKGKLGFFETGISESQIRLSNHNLVTVGGRPCPAGIDDCSQGVYKCSRCNMYDYGEKGGNAHTECIKCSRIIYDEKNNTFVPRYSESEGGENGSKF
jgi:hypothetical protein